MTITASMKNASGDLKGYIFPCVILKDKFKFHDEIKNDLLSLINKAEDKSWNNKDHYFDDQLSKTDWPLAHDSTREWVKKYKNNFGEQLSYFANILGYKDIHLNKIWYQQYSKDGTHGWHVHGGSYTGTYYLELPKDAPTTEFLYTDNLNKSFTIKVKEGDIIFFPCHFIHRSAKSQSENMKTIISWNIDFNDILQEHVHKTKEIVTFE